MLGWLVRVSALAGPLVTSIVVAWSLTAVAPSPGGPILAIVRWLVIAAISSGVLVMLERAGRRLIPIASLLDLTLVFPDRAPSRFRVALRTGTTSQLQRRIDETREGQRGETPADAARRVIELVAALRVHDHITRGHSERVRAYTQMIADEMELSDHERDRLRWAGLLHDVGKLLVPTSILNKRGTLTDDEFEIVKSHPENGRKIIEPLIPWLGESARAVWEHHEKWDGSGYPKRLAGDEISLAARIVAVADVYDVLTSARSYKDPITPREARAELARCAGTHFDPVVVRAFLTLSIGRVRRAAGPLSWLAQLALFPTAVFSSTQVAGSAILVTGAIGASSAGIGPNAVHEAFSNLDARGALAWIHPDRQVDDVWTLSSPVASATNGAATNDAGAIPPSTTAPDPIAPRAVTTTIAGPAPDGRDLEPIPFDGSGTGTATASAIPPSTSLGAPADVSAPDEAIAPPMLPPAPAATVPSQATIPPTLPATTLPSTPAPTVQPPPATTVPPTPSTTEPIAPETTVPGTPGSKPAEPPGKPAEPPGKPAEPPGKPAEPPGKPAEPPGKPAEPSS